MSKEKRQKLRECSKAKYYGMSREDRQTVTEYMKEYKVQVVLRYLVRSVIIITSSENPVTCYMHNRNK